MKKRVYRYSGKFWGVNQVALASFRDRIPSLNDRAAAFDLLANMLLGSRWNFHDPDAEFILSMRQIRKLTGWGYTTIRGGIRTLTGADILYVNEAGKTHTYNVNCEALGMRPKSQRSKKKASRPYSGEYVGLTRILIKWLRKKLPQSQGRKGPERSKCLWVLINMLVHSDWKSYKAEEAIQMSLYDLESHTGMTRMTVRKYRDMLIEAGFLDVYQPGGRGMVASYALDLGLAGIHAQAKNPTKQMEFPLPGRDGKDGKKS